MTHKLWLTITLLAVGASVFVVSRWPGKARHDEGLAPEVSERLERLELSERRRLDQRPFALAPAKLSAAAAAPAAEPAEGTAEHSAREEEKRADQVEKERRLFARLDVLARSGGGSANAALLRKNLDEAKTTPRHRDLKIGAIDCSDALCRVEVALAKGANPVLAAMAMGPGMGGMSMQPLSSGPAVMYVAAPGTQLPSN